MCFFHLQNACKLSFMNFMIDLKDHLIDTHAKFQKWKMMMIFTRLKFNNLCAFSDAEINLSYPRQLANSPLDNEFLHGRPKFYYRKVCVITGANASGKTSLGRMIWGLQSFLVSKNLHSSAFPINDKNKCASFEADFASDDFTHHRIYVRFKSDPSGSHIINELKYARVYIGENDSCVKTTKQLDLEFASHERKKAVEYFHGVAAEGYSVNLEEFKKFDSGQDGIIFYRKPKRLTMKFLILIKIYLNWL